MRKIMTILISIVLLLSVSLTAFADNSEDAVENSLLIDAAESDVAEVGNADEYDIEKSIPVINSTFSGIGSDAAAETGWSFDSYRDDDSYMAVVNEDDNYCLHLVAAALNDVKALQNIIVEPNSCYKISARVKTKGVEGGNGANISVINSMAFSNIVTGDSDWTEITLIGTTNQDQNLISIALRIGGYGAESVGEAWFDDVTVDKLKNVSDESKILYMESSSNDNEDDDSSENQVASSDDKTKNWLPVVMILCFVIVVLYLVFTNKRANGKTGRQIISDTAINSADGILLNKTDTKLHFTKKDTVFLIALIIIYSFVALTNLGTTQAPSTAWIADRNSEPAIIKFDGVKDISNMYVFGGIDEGGMLRVTDDKGNEICTYEQENTHMYRWHNISGSDFSTSYVKVEAIGTELDIKEIAFFNEDKKPIIGTATGDGASLVDEPEQIPEEFSSRNGMYFDELYHGRTGYEHYMGLTSYENSHPPLGKIFISIGIALFGMNALGWRIIGVLFGIGMIPIFYCFAKYVFKKSSFAMVASILFSFDFMHFTQTRIATIDVYGVFFILLMFYFMYKYFTMSFFRDGLSKTLVPLGLAGVFFGLGIASKWICFYAGAGLAVMLLVSFIMRGCEYYKYRNSDNEAYKNAVSAYWKNILITVIFCCGFFLLIPVTIYSLSYLVYPDAIEAFKSAGIKGYLDRVWYYQDFMFNYHSGLTATHTYQSTWIEWALDLRPMWYSINYYDEGCIATISAMGNPIVWWLSLAGTIGLFVQVIRGKIKLDAPVKMIFIGIAANILPWMVISRCAFIYHYFATVPFIIFAALYFIKSLEEKYEWFRYFKWWWCAIALILFAVFYPVIAGIKIDESYALSLEWIRSWWFVRNANAPDNSGIINGIIINTAIALSAVVFGILSKSNVFDKLVGKFQKKGETQNGK